MRAYLPYRMSGLSIIPSPFHGLQNPIQRATFAVMFLLSEAVVTILDDFDLPRSRQLKVIGC